MSRVLALLLVGAVLALGAAFLVVPGWVGRGMNPVVAPPPAEPGAEAVRLHATLDIVDLHADALLWKRDLSERGGWGHLDLPRMREGRIAVQAFTAVTKTPRGQNVERNAADSDNITWLALFEGWPLATLFSLRARALHQADELRQLARGSEGGFTILGSEADLDRFLARRRDDPELVAGFLGIEGAHPLEGELDNVDVLFRAGYRMFGLTHFFDNEVGGSAHGLERGGLTPFGEAVVDRAGELGIVVDLAHASPALVDDVLARVRHPVVVSHGGVRGTCDNRRNVDDERLRGIAATGGVMGVGLWETAVCGTTPAAWARAVRHAVEVTGVEHVALGSDWDGAVEAIVPADGTVHLVDALLAEGFTESEIRLVMGENVLRVLRAVLPDGPRS